MKLDSTSSPCSVPTAAAATASVPTPSPASMAFPIVPLPPVLTEKDAAAMLGVPLKSLRQWRYADELRGTYTKKGRHILYLSQKLMNSLFQLRGKH